MFWPILLHFLTLVGAQRRALVIIDVQKDFLPGGSLAVPFGNEIIPLINDIRKRNTFDLVVFTQDWHTPMHVSFASSHEGYQPFDNMRLSYTRNGSLCSGPSISPAYSIPCENEDVAVYLNQTLWPDHCVQDTPGADISSELLRAPTDLVVKKGYRPQIDSYSAFWDNGDVAATELDALLKSRDIKQIFVTGLALDFCVFATAMDGPKENFQTFVIEDATRGIDPAGMKAALADLIANNIAVLNASGIPVQTCDVIEKMPGCSVPALNETQADIMLTELCARFNKSYTLQSNWCGILDSFNNCTATQRVDYALNAWAHFASECCAPLMDGSACVPFTPPAAPTPAVAPPTTNNPPSASPPTAPPTNVHAPTSEGASPTPVTQQATQDSGADFNPTAVILVMAIVVAISMGIAYIVYVRARRRHDARHKALLVPLVATDAPSDV